MKCRPDLGTPEKRAIRQRCAFGCVICGCPVYEYHHIEGVDVSNAIGDITLLCDLHHKQYHNGLLPKSKVRADDKLPYGRRHGTTTPYGLHFTGSARSIILATDTITAPEAPELHGLVIDGRSLISLRAEGDYALLNIEMFDKSNTPVLRIEDNELQYSTGHDWDITFEGLCLSIKSSPKRNDYRAVIKFQPERGVVIEKASFHYNGVSLLADGTWVRFPGFEGCGNRTYFGGTLAAAFIQAGIPRIAPRCLLWSENPPRTPLEPKLVAEAQAHGLDV